MCGRYALAATVDQIVARFAVAAPAEGQTWTPHYNLAPSQSNPVVVGNGSAHLELMQWGLVPSWSKEPKTEYSTINARIETAAERSAYRTPFRRQRCLVPATGYYEWQAGGGSAGKQPYYIQVQADDPEGLFAFAGLYDIWHGPDGRALTTYTILTTAADPVLAPIHARMPVVVPRTAEAAWLDPHLTDPAEILALLTPPPSEGLRSYPVSAAVNSPANDSPELVRPLS